MNAEPLEATAWTLLIIAVLFILGFGVLLIVDVLRAPPGSRGLSVTPKQRGLLLGMGAAVAPPLLTELVMRSFSPYLFLAATVPLTLILVLLSRWLGRSR